MERAGDRTFARQGYRLGDDNTTQRITAVLDASRTFHHGDAIGGERVEIGRMLTAPLLILLPHPLIHDHDAVPAQAMDDRFAQRWSTVQ